MNVKERDVVDKIWVEMGNGRRKLSPIVARRPNVYY